MSDSETPRLLRFKPGLSATVNCDTYKMEVNYNALRMSELRALARECSLQGYHRLKKVELIALLQDNKPVPTPTPVPSVRPRPPKPMRPPPPPPKDLFAPYELERDFKGAYWSFRINGRSRMDVETFEEIKGSVTNLIAKEVQDLDVAKVQMTAWILLKVEVEDGDGNIIGVDMVDTIDTVDKAFDSQMAEVFQGSNLDEILDEKLAHMRTQVENLALVNSRFVFSWVLSLDVNFHHLNLTQGSSYFPLPDWIMSKKAIINPWNEEKEECFKWAILVALHQERTHSEYQISEGLMAVTSWRGLTLPIALDKISIFEWKNNLSVNVLAIAGEKLYIFRKVMFDGQRMANLLLIAQEGKKHYATIKNLSWLLTSSNSEHQHQQHFCLNCLQGFHSEASRNKHFK